MATELIAVVSTLRLVPTSCRKDLGRLLIWQSQCIEGITEQILVAVSEVTVHLLIGDHVVGEMQYREVQAVVASLVKYDLT
jgi:hypothetical protein